MDNRISREKAGILSRSIAPLRQHFSLEVIQDNDTNEEKLHQKLQENVPHLVLAPHYRYTEWHRIEGLLGGSRNAGPTFAGYSCEALPFFSPPVAHPTRGIHLDFHGLHPKEIFLLVHALAHERMRTGLKPLLSPRTPLYCENWYDAQGHQGNRIDTVLRLSEIEGHWKKHGSSIRILLSALWSLFYEEGPGKAHLSQTPKAYFQIGADAQCLGMRLYYRTATHFSVKDALKQFQPDSSVPSTRAAQLLLKYSDFLRVQVISENSEIEVVAGLFQTSPAETFADQKHSVWIDQISVKLVDESPFAAPSPQDPDLRPLVTSFTQESKPLVLHEVKNKIIELKHKVQAQDHLIQTLKSSSPSPAVPSDIEGILEAFQKKYFDAKYQLHQIETQIQAIEKEGTHPAELKDLRLKMEALAHREKAWIKKIMETLQAFRKPGKKLN